VRDLIPEPDRSDAHLHAIIQLAIASVSVGSTSHLITNIIFNLATWPEYQIILKDEIDEILKVAGGQWTVESMAQLTKLDSFMKESFRHNGHVTSKWNLFLSLSFFLSFFLSFSFFLFLSFVPYIFFIDLDVDLMKWSKMTVPTDA
jgi:hypothetical protein